MVFLLLTITDWYIIVTIQVSEFVAERPVKGGDGMKPLELKAERVRRGYTQKDVAEGIGMKLASYNKKENGVNEFSDLEKKQLSDFLGFTPYQLNYILYDGLLPIGAEL